MIPAVGETVKSKKDGRVMTVKAIDTDDQGQQRVTCVWLNMAMEEQSAVYLSGDVVPVGRPKRLVATPSGYSVEGDSKQGS